MANVYVSFLGTNNYLHCHYHTASFITPEPVRFVQEATVRYRCSNWGSEDRILIFTTEEAENKNWKDGGHVDPDSKVPHEGLCSRLAKLNLKTPVHPIRIEPGYDSEQIWRQFDTIFEALKPGDHVVFDITHAFRSIPMLAMVVIQYARVFKAIGVEGIYYGAFEALGSFQEVKKISSEDRKAPIIDLQPLAELMDWTVATDRFLKGGDAAMIGELARRSVEPILKETRGADEGARAVRKLGKCLEAFSMALSTCRGLEISDAAFQLKEQSAVCSRLNLLPPFTKLFDRIEERIRGFSKDHVRDGLIAVRWCCEHGLIQQGFTLLEELLFSAVLLELYPDRKKILQDMTYRDIVSQSFGIICYKLKPDGWNQPAADHRQEVEAMLDWIRQKPGLVEAYGKIRERRNDLNHAGHNNNALSLSRAAQFSNELKELVSQVESALLT